MERNENSIFPFRDGEDHCGEAVFDDICNGFNDGELSDNCLIFIAEEDNWIPIEQFLDMRRKRAKCNDKNGNENKNVDEKDYSIVTNGQGNQTIVDLSRAKKKPSRDSSTWGKTTSISTSIPTTVNKLIVSNDTKELVVKQQQPNGSQLDVKPNNIKGSNKRKKGNVNHIRPPPKLMKYVIQGIMQFDMIKEGDRLLLGLSGGKDSLTLLHCLLELKRKLPTKFDLEVCTIDPMTPSFDPSPLIPYVESLGLKYHYIKDNIVERANSGGKLHRFYIFCMNNSTH